MAANNSSSTTYEDIDEAEEEALLKSDDENDAARGKPAPPNLQLVAPAATLTDEDSLMNEAAQLADQGEVEEGISKDGTEGGEDKDEVDESDDGNDEAEDQLLQDFKSTLEELEKNQYAYDKYVHLCELSHATDDLDNIRNAYNRFAGVYPLSPELWLKYLNIEKNVALSPKEVEKVELLFNRALSDYYSHDIALEFIAFAPRTTKPDHIWEEVLGTYGLHCLQGHEFFKRYRQFISSQGSVSIDKQQNAYIQSYLQELKYPLNNMEESYIEFKVFYEKNKTHITQNIDWEIIDKNYFKVKEHLQKILPFEEELKHMDHTCYSERAALYATYIKESDKFLDENILQTLYERMVAECCLNAECWLTYVDFIDYRDEFGRPEELQELPVFQQNAVDICSRALRNCTWSEKLYIKRIHLLEKRQRPREEVQEVLESSMSAGFQTAEPAVAVWLEYLTYLRRHTDWKNEGECDILRKNFNLAWTILGQQWGVLADSTCEILQFWGRLEYGQLQDPKRGKELWTTVMESSDNATKSGLWTEFAQLEIHRDLEATRKLYHKSLHAPGLDNPFVIAASWERFERCNGSIKSLCACIKACTEFLAAFKPQRQHSAGDVAHTKSLKNTFEKGRKRKSVNIVTDVAKEKKEKKVELDVAVEIELSERPVVDQKESSVTFKEHESQEIDLAKDSLRIFLSNLNYSLTEDDIRAGLQDLKIVNVDLIRSANGRSRGFGYLELESTTEVEKALSMDRRTFHGRPLYVSSVLRDKEKRQKFKYSDGLEPKKLFVKGIPHDASRDELDEIFAAFGKLKDVRLVYHKSGKFKNIAYVEFEDEAAAGKAIMGVDQMDLRGHTISVAISAPPPKVNTLAVAIAPKQLLGMSTKRSNVFNQKPRMSLIPNVVRKRLTVPLQSTQASINGAAERSVKTNADFRKLLQKPN